jgi:hypothetical protein
MIVVVLAVVWVIALTPMVLRRISERQFTSGVRSYHRRLSGLSTASAASSGSAGSMAPSVPGALIGFSLAAQRLREERSGVYRSAPDAFASDISASDAAILASSFEHVVPASIDAVPASISTSPATAARRRQIVALLVGATVFFFLVGIIPAARILWDMALLALGCTAAYVALLIHFHRLFVERAQKVIALRTRRHVTAELESRRHVVTLDQAERAAIGGGYAAGAYATGRYPAGAYVNAGSNYSRASEPVLSGSGWSMIGVQSPEATGR